MTRLLCYYAAKDGNGQCDWSACGVHTKIPKGTMDAKGHEGNADVFHHVSCARVLTTHRLHDGEHGDREREEDQRESPHGWHERLRLLVSQRTMSHLVDLFLLN